LAVARDASVEDVVTAVKPKAWLLVAVAVTPCRLAPLMAPATAYAELAPW